MRILSCILAIAMLFGMTALAEPAIIVNCDEWVSLRAEPSTSAKRLAKVPKGATVSIVGVYYDFYQCEWNGMRGYILAEYLGEAREPACTDAEEADVVNCDEWVSLRAEPSTSAKRLAKVPLGATVTARPYDEDFSLCVWQGQTGYILSEYLSREPQGNLAAGSGKLLPNVSEFLTLRDAPRASGAELAKIMPGTEMTILGCSGVYAKVRVDNTGKVGYVHSGYVRDARVSGLPWPYDYEKIMQEVNGLDQIGMDVEIIGQSLDGRDIPVVRVGDGETHILVQAGIHGRELMTSYIALELLRVPNSALEDVTLHVIPLVNPDGLTIAIHGPDALKDADLRKQVAKILSSEGESYKNWKANARGVDLNRNFPVGWDALTGRTPASARYRGPSPLSEPESIVLAEYTRAYPFAAAISLHSYGSVIYWQGENDHLSAPLARTLSERTGYPMASSESSLERGGFKDWALDALSIPSVTLELGSRTSQGSLSEATTLACRLSLHPIAAALR